jgi:hypothetical protein
MVSLEFFQWHNPSSRTMALGSTQKWVPCVFPGGKGGRWVRLTTLPPFCAVVMKSGNLNFLEPSGTLQACNGTALPFYRLAIGSQCPRELRYGSAAIHLIGLWVRIPPRAWMSVCCECCVLAGRGICDELITRPEDSCGASLCVI